MRSTFARSAGRAETAIATCASTSERSRWRTAASTSGWVAPTRRGSASTTGWTMRSSSSSIRGMTCAVSCALKGRGCSRRRVTRDERADVSRLARADGARPGSPVQALQRRRGPAPSRVARPYLPRVTRRGRDLLRPRAPCLQPAAHRSRRRRGVARHALVRRPRVGHVRPRRRQHLLERGLTTLRRVPAIVIPYRGDAKRRVSSPLRAAVAVAMLGDVVEAALAVGRVLVVTDDPAVVPPDAEVVADPGRGLGHAVEAALSRVDGHALVVNADLPATTAGSLHRLADSGLALVEAPDGTTNALSLPDPGTFAPLYGPGSADRFRAHAPFVTAPIPELEMDVDADSDLERLSGRLGRRTRALLAVPA